MIATRRTKNGNLGNNAEIADRTNVEHEEKASRPKERGDQRPVKDRDSAASQGLAKLGSRAALSFAFAFLRRAWRSGEDGDICSDLLQAR